MPLADPSVLYSPGDFTAIRKRIFEDSLNAVKNRFPIENSRYSLSLEDVDYENPRDFSLKEQKAAVQNDQSLSWKMSGSWVLRDKATGNVVSKSSKRTVMNVPYMTERGTFIRNGTETTLPLQMRLVPGVYTRMGEDNIAKAHINTRPGTGNTVMMQLNPAKPVFRVSVGTRNYDLFPLLKHLGVTDEEMIAAWGKDLYNANKEAFMKAGGWYKAKTAADTPDPNDPWEKAAKDVLGGELDPDNTMSTFGTAYTKVDPQLLLASSKRLVGLAKGEHSGDNRDSMENQRFFGPADYISERIRLDAGGLLRNLLWRTSRYGDAQRIPSSPLSKYVDGLFTESKLAQSIEETNLLDAYKRATMVTRMGEGGIGSIESAPMSARLVHNTYKGFIDPIASPECTPPDHYVFTRQGWKPIAEVTTDDMVACYIGGRLEYRHPEQTVSYDFNGDLYCCRTAAVAYRFTGNHRVWCKRHPRGGRVKRNGYWQKEYAPEYGFEFAQDIHDKPRLLMSSGHAPLKHDTVTTKTITSDEDSFTFGIKDWCAFLGWYISEGSVLHKGGYCRWVMISQVESVNKENCDEIADLLNRMGIKFRFNHKCFHIISRALWNELHVLGYCDDKYIPEEVFNAPWDAKNAFVSALLKGDGRKSKSVTPVLCTTSERLARDYERLLFEMGEAVSVKFEKDDRKPQYLGCWTVRVLQGKDIWLFKNSDRLNRHSFYTEHYEGKVYCLTVPGGLFYTRCGDKHGFWTGNSLRVGLDTQIARSAKRGPDGLMYSPLINSKTGQREYVSTLESSKVAVSFPEYASSKSPIIPAMVGNDIEMVPKSKVAYFVPNGDSLFATASNFVPIKSGIKAGRLLMAQKHQTQAMSIKDRMAPYVQSLDPDGSGKSVEEVDSGILGAVRADQPGKVVKVTKDDITVLQADGTKHTYSLYNNFPLNRKSVVNNTAEVKPGDMVDKGTLLASSSYTDKNGVAAMGTQLRTGWLSFKGWNYLDAIVVSESAAKKLTSEHFYHEGVDRDEGTSIGRDRYISAFPGKFNRDQLATIDDNGAVKPGTIVKKGDPLVLAMSLRPGGPGTGYRALHKDVSAVWEHDFPGEVTDVVDAKDGARVYVKAWVPLQTGDKLATRFANKGTAALVVPDERMPRAADGRPLEVLFSPTGIVSRVNSAAMIEAALGKVSEKTGKRYILPGFGTNLVKFAKKELKEAGLTDRENVTDPETGRIIPGVFVGNSYITKFHHTSESKGGARATGAYTADEQPATGGHDGAKTLGGLVLGAFAGHGASEVLKDMKLIKGQKNTDFWRDFKMGKTPAMPGTPLVYKRFLASLEASGIHVTRDGDNTNIFAMTNGDVRRQARAELKNATTYDEKKFLPMKGGLFDPAIFGQNGDQWAYIPVDEPILNPVMDDVVCNFLNLKKAELDEVIAGMRKLPNGMTGGEGLRKQLASLNLDTMIENAKNTIRSGPVSRRDKAIKTLRWASAMKKHDATPDQFMLDEIPVLPPRYRRITRSGDLNMVADANYLYKELLDARNDLREAKEAGLPNELLGFGRKRVTDAFRAVTGLADPSDTKLKESGVSGLLKWVFGKGSPKMGALQRLVIGGKLDVAGRGVINIDPRLGMDEVGVPENQAWDLYRDFVIRKLVQGGMNPLMATKAAVEHSPSAREAMLQVMKDRPLIATRAPALHKYSVQAFRPKLVVGNTMKLNSVVEKAFNADFDGDDHINCVFIQLSGDALKAAFKK